MLALLFCYSSKMTTKKRKVDSECRVFKEEWSWKYFFTEFKDKPVCLICNETVAVFKDFNLSRHFSKKHASAKYLSMTEAEKKSFVERQKEKLRGQQNMFTKQSVTQKAATLASYVVAYKIAKSNRTLSDGEFVKDCMVAVSNIICPEKSKEFQSLALSRRTITDRIDAIAKQLSSQLEMNCNKFEYFSLTMDESTDMNDTAQLLIFIRAIDSEFNITEELACLQSLKGKTTGKIIYDSCFEGISKFNLPMDKLCNITTDGAPNMVGSHLGFMGIFCKENPNNNVLFLHCLIHQDVLCKAAIDIQPVLSVVVKLINTIRSRGLMHRQFQEFLKSTESEFSDILYHTKVRWLSCGNAFERVWNLRKEIQDFLTEQGKWDDFKIMADENWLPDFAFFTDLLSHLNKLNTKLQGKNQFLDELWGHLKAFKLQLKLFCSCVEKNELTHFPKLSSISPVSDDKLNRFAQQLKKLHEEFEKRFQDFKRIEQSLNIFSMPFNVNVDETPANLQLELIEMQCNTHLKQLFLNTNKLEFYKSISRTQYPNIVAHAQKIMAMFGTSYLCEQTFSIMKLRKNCLRNRLSDDHLFSLLKISASQMEPAYDDIMQKQKQFHMSHVPTKTSAPHPSTSQTT